MVLLISVLLIGIYWVGGNIAIDYFGSKYGRMMSDEELADIGFTWPIWVYKELIGSNRE
jgi:hypothetical protein